MYKAVVLQFKVHAAISKHNISLSKHPVLQKEKFIIRSYSGLLEQWN